MTPPRSGRRFDVVAPLLFVAFALPGAVAGHARSSSRPVPVEDLYESGFRALAEKRTDAALDLLSACVEADPNHAECWWELGWAWWVKEDYQATVRCWERVQRLEPGRSGLAKYLPQAKSRVSRSR